MLFAKVRSLFLPVFGSETHGSKIFSRNPQPRDVADGNQVSRAGIVLNHKDRAQNAGVLAGRDGVSRVVVELNRKRPERPSGEKFDQLLAHLFDAFFFETRQ
jgi:hypothetical protein